MGMKEKISSIIKEHKVLKEQLIVDLVNKSEQVDDNTFLQLATEVFGIGMNKVEFKKHVIKGDMSVDKLQEFAKRCETVEDPNLEGSMEEDEMKRKMESDGAAGEHEDPNAPVETPVSPAAAGAGVTGDAPTNQAQATPVVTPDAAGDGSSGDHKAEQMDDEYSEQADDEYKEQADDEYTEQADGEEDKNKLEQLEDEQNEIKEALEGDLVNLLKDIIAKVRELESKIVGMENVETGEEEENIEPQPPITQEGLHGATPLRHSVPKDDNIARSVGKSFFNTRSKR